jgi:hypothetical protein
VQQAISSEDVARSRARFGVIVIFIGVAGLVGALIGVLFKVPNETGGTLLGVVTSPIAAIVAAYFGISVARAASEEAGAAKAEAGLANVDKVQSIQKMTSAVERAARGEPLPAEQAASLAQEAADEARA